MKTSKAMLLAAAALLSFSCAKENLKETESPASSGKELVEMTFNAFAGEETKTAIGSKGDDGKYPVNWVSTDKIAVLDGITGDTYQFDYKSGEGSKATFIGKVPADTKEFYAVYPYMEGVTCDGTEYIGVELDNDQKEYASNISSGIMVAYADADKNLKFMNVTAFIKITIPEGITFVSFEGANKENITGQLSFKFDGTTVGEVSAEGLNANTASFGDMETELKAGTYYLAVAPVALPNGFTVTYADKNGIEKTEKGTKDPNLKPGEILDLGTRDPFKEEPAPPATKAYYEKVTTAPTNWSGDYLIVYETGSVAFDGSPATFDGTNNYQTVNINNERIEATTETDAISFEISSTEGGYYVKSTSGYYIGRDAASNGVDYSTTTRYLNTISSSCVISGKGQITLQVYSVNGQKPQINFKYYKSKQNAIALYKRNINIDRKDVPSLGLSTDAASVTAAETSATFDILSNTDWSVTTDADWIKDYDKNGKENGTVTIKFDANTVATARTATFTVKTADNAISKTFTLTQKAFGAETKVTYDFTKIDGFADWSTGYSEHAVNYTESIVTFKSANKNTSTIKDQPVTKGDDVTAVMTGTKTIKSVKFICKQWGAKTQTITLNTSTDGGKNYTATSTKSSNFTLEATNLSDGINAVKFTFTSQSNQVGISSLEITYAE